MKTTVQIPLTPEVDRPLFLLYEISDTCIFSVWYHKEPNKIVGISFHELSKKRAILDYFKLIHEDNITKASPKGILISYNAREMLLVPEIYSKSDSCNSMLSLVFGDVEATTLKKEKITNSQIDIIYRIPVLMNEYVMNDLGCNNCFHSGAKLMTEDSIEPTISCVVYANFIRLFVCKNNQIQLLQYFDYSSPEDVVYHILNCCKQLEINPADLFLTISGLIVEDSNLYRSIYNYVKGITLKVPADSSGILMVSEESPIHFFTHLIELLLCV